MLLVLIFIGVMLAVITQYQTLLLGRVSCTMATFLELRTALVNIAAGVNDLEKAIADLKASVGNGGIVTQAELDELAHMAADINDDIADKTDQEPAGSPTSPEAPIVIASTAAINTVMLAWDSIKDAVSYNVKRGDASGTEAQLANTTDVFFHDVTTVAGSTYFYTVSAVDAKGTEGKASAEVSYTA